MRADIDARQYRIDCELEECAPTRGVWMETGPYGVEVRLYINGPHLQRVLHAKRRAA